MQHFISERQLCIEQHAAIKCPCAHLPRTLFFLTSLLMVLETFLRQDSTHSFICPIYVPGRGWEVEQSRALLQACAVLHQDFGGIILLKELFCSIIWDKIFCPCIKCPFIFFPQWGWSIFRPCWSRNCCQLLCQLGVWGRSPSAPAKLPPSPQTHWRTARRPVLLSHFLTMFFLFPRQQFHTFSYQLCSLMGWTLRL